MLSESLPQKLLYILSRGPHRGPTMVLAFVALIGSAALYDTMLWGLDSPGYILQGVSAPASTIRDHLVPRPAYVVLADSKPGDVGALDLKRDFSAGLWDARVNVSLSGVVARGSVAVASRANYTRRFPNGPNPRIWLDDDGFSVGIDYAIEVNSYGGCLPEREEVDLYTWDCRLNLSDDHQAPEFFNQCFAKLNIWWDARKDSDYETIGAYKANPWYSLGTGGNTILMKTVITVTRSTSRHMFLISAFKVTLTSYFDDAMDIAEIQNLVERMSTTDNTDTAKVMGRISSAVSNGNGIMLGKQSRSKYKVHSRIYQFLKFKVQNFTVGSTFQIFDVTSLSSGQRP